MARFNFRFVILFLCVIATCVDYVTRVNINVAMVTMVAPNNSSDIKLHDACPIPDFKRKPINGTVLEVIEGDRFQWDQTLQGIILGSFFYSYVFMQVPAGRMAELFGGKWIIAIGILGSGIINLITPLIASYVWLFVLSRVFLGIIQGGIYPAAFSLIYNWLPKRERALGFGFLDAGGSLGSIVATSITGYLSEHGVAGIAGGWPSAFYVAGLMGCGSFMVFAPLVTSSPDKHRFVSKAELNYIKNEKEDTQSFSKEFEGSDDTTPKVQRTVPWVAILTSRAVLSVVFAKFTIAWTSLTLQSKLPKYLDDVLHMSPTKNGMLNATLSLTNCVTLCCGGFIAEQIIERRLLSRTNSRKLFVGIAYTGSSLCLALVPFARCNETGVIGLLITSTGFLGLVSGGDTPIPSELTRHFPATVYSFMNMVAMSSGFIAPYFAGVVLESGMFLDIIDLWSCVFWFSSILSLIGALVFATYGSADIQDWDHLGDDDVKQLKAYAEANDEEPSRSVNHEAFPESPGNNSLYLSCERIL